MFNVRFNLGTSTTELIEVNVKNIPAHFIRWERIIDSNKTVGYTTSPNMDKVYALWEEYNKPVVLDCRGKSYCTWANQDH